MKFRYFFTVLTLLVFSTNIYTHSYNNTSLNDESSSVEAYDEGIQFFVGTWDQALQMADLMNRPIFVYVYNIYTPSCKRMAKNVFTQYDAVRFYHDNYVNYKLNLNSAEGMRFKETYNFNKYPSYLFFDKTGKLISSDSGEKTLDEFIKLGQKNIHQNSSNQSVDSDIPKLPVIYTNYLSYKSQYRDGIRNPEFLSRYAYQLKKFNDNYNEVVDEYINYIGTENLNEPKHIRFIFDFADDLSSRAFNIMLTNRRKYISKIGRQEFFDKVKSVVKTHVITAAANNNQLALNKALSTVSRAQIPNSKEFIFNMQLDYYKNTGHWQQYAITANDYLVNHEVKNAKLLDETAWNFVLHVYDYNQLSKAASWSKKIQHLNPKEFRYIETYSAILYRLGKKNKAVKEADKAIETAKAQSKDYISTLKLIQAIKTNGPINETFRKN